MPVYTSNCSAQLPNSGTVKSEYELPWPAPATYTFSSFSAIATLSTSASPTVLPHFQREPPTFAFVSCHFTISYTCDLWASREQVLCLSQVCSFSTAIEGTRSVLTKGELGLGLSLLGLFYFRLCVCLECYSLLLKESRVLVIKLRCTVARRLVGQGLCPWPRAYAGLFHEVGPEAYLYSGDLLFLSELNLEI